MPNPGVYIAGASGHPNFGDDKIALQWVNFYRERGYERILLETISPTFMTALSNISGTEFDPINLLFDNILIRPKTLIKDALVEGLELFNEKSLGLSGYKWILQLFSSINIIHLHGGGYINSLWPHTAYMIGALVALKRELKIPLVATGLGLMPLDRGDAEALGELLAEFDLVEVRDSDSFRALPSLPTILDGADDIFLYPAFDAHGDWRRAMHVALQEFTGYDALLSEVEACLERDGGFDRVVVYNFSPRSDRAAYERFRRGPILCDDVDYFDLFASPIQTGPDDVAVVSRFHAHLMLARAGVRGFYVSPDTPYYDFKHSSVVDLGSHWKKADKELRLDPDALHMPNIDSAAIHARKRALGERILSLSGVTKR